MALVAHPSAVPLLVTHAWPGSVVEFLGGDRPADHAAGPPDAFHVVVPSLPGYGFSSRPTTAGWGRHADRGRVGRHDWVMTVRRSRRWLGAIADQFPQRVIGVHVNMPVIDLRSIDVSTLTARERA